jgi:hypothetical protein
MFAALGSVVLPFKAVLMNVVSLGAAFGAIVFIFQEGHLASTLNYTITGTIEPTNPILMIAVLFGLATDYELFLLSRIREEWQAGADKHHRRCPRPATHRPDHHLGGATGRDRGRRIRHRTDRHHQTPRRRHSHRHRHRHRRQSCAGTAGTGDHAAARQMELVDPRLTGQAPNSSALP